MRAVDFEARFRGRSALSGSVAFEDDSTVEEVPAKRKMQVVGGIGRKAERLHGWEGVDGCDDFGDLKRNGG